MTHRHLCEKKKIRGGYRIFRNNLPDWACELSAALSTLVPVLTAVLETDLAILATAGATFPSSPAEAGFPATNILQTLFGMTLGDLQTSEMGITNPFCKK